MPNFCANQLIVIGAAAEVAALRRTLFVVTADDDTGAPVLDFSLERSVPTPPALLALPSPIVGTDEHPDRDIPALVSQYGYADWYEWRVAHWGTKWDVDDCQLECDEPTLCVITFQTAWAPPLAAIQTLAARFPGLTVVLDYCEPHLPLRGVAAWRGSQPLRYPSLPRRVVLLSTAPDR